MAVSSPGLSHFHIPKKSDHFIFPVENAIREVRFLTAGAG